MGARAAMRRLKYFIVSSRKVVVELEAAAARSQA